MQSLSTLCSVGTILPIANLDTDTVSCRISRGRTRRKYWVVPVHVSSIYLSSYFSNLDKWRSLGLNSVHGFLPNCQRCVFREGNRSSSRRSVALALALEQEPVGSEHPKEGRMVLEKFQSKEGGLDTINGIKNDAFVGIQGNREENDLVEEGMGERNRVELVGKEKVDVRKLAVKLWDVKTADDVEVVLKDSEELPLPVYCSMMRGFGFNKRLDPAFALFEWLKRKRKGTDASVRLNVFIYNSLLGAVKQTDQFEKVGQVMEDMKSQGIVPNIVTFNTLMSIYIEQDRADEALNIIADIERNGLLPSPVTYSTALLAYRKMEDANGAIGYYVLLRERFQKGELKKDKNYDWESEFVKLENFTARVCYLVMRQWLVKEDNPTAKVFRLLSDLDKAQVRRSRTEYERLAWACTKESHYDVAKELYRRIREMKQDISLSVCNHLIWLMGKAKKWWAALEIYEDLLDKGPKPNNLSYELIVSHFNVLLTAARRRGIWRWGVRLLNKMQDKGLRPGSREWNAVLVACSKASETSAAVDTFRRMVEQGEKPTVLSYGALLSALEKGKLYDEALRVWDHMCKMGVKPNLYAYTILASIYIGMGRPAEVDNVLHEMISAGIEPTVVTFNAIITGFSKNHMGSAAFEWFHRMKVRNVEPNEITYDVLIEALARDGRPRLAYEMYLRAFNEGLRLSSKTYDAVIESSQSYGTSIDLNALGPRPIAKRKGIKIPKNSTEFCNTADLPRRRFDKAEMHFSSI